MSFTRQVLVFIGIWALLIYVFLTKLNNTSTIQSEENLKLENLRTYLESTRTIDEELRKILDEYINEGPNNESKLEFLKKINQKLQESSGDNNQQLEGGTPSIEYENYRRRLGSNVAEYWNHVSAGAEKIEKLLKSDDSQQALKELSSFMQLNTEHKRSLKNDLEKLAKNDGYEAFRQTEAASLSDLVQRRLHFLQNPPDCAQARKLVCKINKGCGYGCQLHHLVYCFIMAYSTERTLIIKSKGWRYHKGGWEEIFLPISETCLDSSGSSTGSWPSESQVIQVPIIDSLNPRPPQLPLAIPADLAPRLMRLHGDPISWWIGQFLKFVLKPQPEVREMLENGMNKLQFKKPIVGVHIRRTDKVGTEAAFHSLAEYMKSVDEYYDQLEMVENIDKRRVFLASDDPKVFQEAIKNFPHYEIIGDPEVAKVAAVSTRYTDSSLNGILLDIHLLSKCDFLVCTFSSQVCRVAYEIMQTFYPDASDKFKSLDDIYYFGGQSAHNVQAVLPHKPDPSRHDQIQMKSGDLVGIAGNHWNGFSKGKNLRTNQNGLFPTFKVNNKIELANFPLYPLVPTDDL